MGWIDAGAEPVATAGACCGTYRGRFRAFWILSISDFCSEIDDTIWALFDARRLTIASCAATAFVRSARAHVARCPDTWAFVTAVASLPAISLRYSKRSDSSE